MLATAGLVWFCLTQSTPAMTPDVEPEPEQLSTRTAWRVTALATPYVVPPVVPATWVPCPWQSFVPCPSFTAVKPFPILPANCWWVARIPVSMM